MSGWRRLEDELDAWHRERRTASLWWRDDDAVEPSARLARLLALAAEHGVPLALAVVPARASAGLAACLERTAASVSVLQHGYDHANHAADAEKPIELSPRRASVAICEELARGRAMLVALFGERAEPVLVPPWNRIGQDLVPALPALGFRGLSMHTSRASRKAAEGLVACNTHVDLLRWKPRREFLGEDAALDLLTGHLRARRNATAGPEAFAAASGAASGATSGAASGLASSRGADPEEPTGLLTHHLVMDEAAWRFVARLGALLSDHPAARWVASAEAFALAEEGGGGA